MASKLKEMDHVDVVLWNPLDPTAWQEASQGVRPQLQSADLSVDAMLAAGLHIAMTRCNGPCFSLEPSSTTYAAHPLLNHHCQLTVQLLIIFTICHSQMVIIITRAQACSPSSRTTSQRTLSVHAVFG